LCYPETRDNLDNEHRSLRDEADEISEKLSSEEQELYLLLLIGRKTLD